MYNLGKSLAHDLGHLSKEELFEDIKAADAAIKHARRDYERDKPEFVLGAVLGELNVRFPGWQHEFYSPQQVAAMGAAGAVIVSPIDEVPYTKEFMTCSVCHKHKGCWSDSEKCSDCDEPEDERKMAYNESLEQIAE